MLDFRSQKLLPAISASQPPLAYLDSSYTFSSDWPSHLGDSLCQLKSLHLDDSPTRSSSRTSAAHQLHSQHNRYALRHSRSFGALGVTPSARPRPHDMSSTGGLYPPPPQYGNSVYQTAPDFRNYNGFQQPQQDSLPPLDSFAYTFGSRSALPKTVSRPESPIFQSDDPIPSRRGSQQTGGIVSYLQIPATISSSKGSLAEFAAQITCLFWFESSATLTSIESSDESRLQTARLAPEAIPPTGFLKWVTTILSTTQVTQNVILLALLFVYRLKQQNPSVKGKPGSEYRLLTVALMLGNKFLDDNTYTNKTWAEVSGISVQEIHVMEVEFLSHMKYNLYTPKEKWHEWHQLLSKFWAYFDRASRRLREPLPPIQTLRPTLQIPPTLPSPPASTNHSPPYGTTTALSPMETPFSHAPAVHATLPLPSGSINVSPTYSHPDMDVRYSGRKRSVDFVDPFASSVPPAKRPSYSFHGQPSARLPHLQTYASQSSPSPFSQLPSLPMSSLPMPVNQTASSAGPPCAATLTPVSAGRATPSQTLPPIQWASGMAMQSALGNTVTPALAPTPLNTTPSRRHNMYMNPTQGHEQTGYPSAAAHSANPNTLSPSHFLIQRTSPYRPVRNMSQLLVPPPTGHLPHQPSQVQYDQMHWQPLGKNPSDRRTGRVPYLNRDAWPQTNQVDQWPSMYPTVTSQH